jgi:Na+/proline symporter
MSLITWSWIFLFGYMGLMVGIGVYAQRQIKHADDFATARGAYGPVFLALAFAASTASGATFLGSPAMSYEWGLSTLWMHFLYPVGVYVGILISMRLVATSGNRFGNRSIPEYLGDRYQSDTMRLMVSLISLVLFFYLAGQLVSGVVMFEIMLGLDSAWALGHYHLHPADLCGTGRCPCRHSHGRRAGLYDAAACNTGHYPHRHGLGCGRRI